MTNGRALPRPPTVAQTRYLRRLFSNPHDVLEELRDQHGPAVGLGAGPARLAVIGDPSTIADILGTPPTSFRWNHKFNVLQLVVGRTSMIVSDGADHRRRRGAVQPGFGRRRLNGWIPMILERTDDAIDELLARHGDTPEQLDMYPVGRALVLQIVVRALFGERLAARTEEIGELFQRPQDYLESPAIRQFPHPLPLGRRHGVRQDRRAFDDIVRSEIRRLRAAPDGDELNVLESLVTESDLSDTEICDQLASLVGAGFDTTAATLAWLLLESVACAGLWDRLGVEADEVFRALDPDRRPDHSTLSALELAGRTVRESLRLHPAGVVGLRETTEDVLAGGYRIPRGTLIAWSPHLAGRDPEHWPDPLTFDPDRHLDPGPEQAALADAAWVPFGGGARNCIGFALAQIELTLIVARFAQRLRCRPVAEAIPAAVGMVVNRPQGGAPMLVESREDA